MKHRQAELLKRKRVVKSIEAKHEWEIAIEGDIFMKKQNIFKLWPNILILNII